MKKILFILLLSLLCIGKAKGIGLSYPSGDNPTLYCIIGMEGADSNVWNLVLATFEPYVGANEPNYDNVFELVRVNQWWVDFPSEVTTRGNYPVASYRQVGSEPNLTFDIPIDSEVIYWNGAKELTLFDIWLDTNGLDSNSPTWVAEVTPQQIQAEMEEDGASLLDTLADRLTAARAGYLDELSAENIPAIIDAIAKDVNRSNNVWYVSKDGSDAYEGHSSEASKLTIMAAVNAAGTGDIVRVYPGTYNETVDLDTANFSGILEGIGMPHISRTGSGEKGIIFENDCTVRGFRVSSTHQSNGSVGIQVYQKDNVKIFDCDVMGSYDAITLDESTDIIVGRCDFEGDGDCFNCGGCDRAYVFSCNLYSNGTYGTGVPSRGMFKLDVGSILFKNCSIKSIRDDSSSAEVKGIDLSSSADVVLSNVYIDVSAGSSDTGNVKGIATTSGTPKVIVIGGMITSSTAGSGTAYDLYNNAGIIRVDNLQYDAAKTSGTIVDRTYALNEILKPGGTGDPNAIWTLSLVIQPDVNEIKTKTDQLNFTGSDVNAVLSPDGLHYIPVTDPNTNPSAWDCRDWLIWGTKVRFGNKNTIDNDWLRTYTEDDVNTITKQSVNDDGTTQTVGKVQTP